jgi:hypothetical protein
MFTQFNTGSLKLCLYSGDVIMQRFVIFWFLLGLDKNRKILMRLKACRAGEYVVGFEKAKGFFNIMFLWLQLL